MKITIGKPISNTQIFIVDEYMNLMPIGITGELCIAGDCVGVGYLNRPELTAERFIDNPFGKGKLYETGDLAYWREDGNIVYVGRNEFQVKIRGLRIELGEIENAISDEKDTAIVDLASNVDVQMDIPLYLIGEGRSYFFMSNRMGECELYEDSSPDADVLTVNTDTLCSGLVLYQDIDESLIEKTEDVFKIKSQHLFVAGIAALVVLWIFVEHLHKKNKSE